MAWKTYKTASHPLFRVAQYKDNIIGRDSNLNENCPVGSESRTHNLPNSWTEVNRLTPYPTRLPRPITTVVTCCLLREGCCVRLDEKCINSTKPIFTRFIFATCWLMNSALPWCSSPSNRCNCDAFSRETKLIFKRFVYNVWDGMYNKLQFLSKRNERNC